MQLTFPNKTEFESDIIIDILNQKDIRYSTKLVCSNIITNVYDINVDIDYDLFTQINKIAQEKIEPYIIASRSYALPSFTPMHELVKTKSMGMNLTMTISNDMPIIALDEMHKRLSAIDGIIDVSVITEKEKEKPKKSKMLQFIEWLRGI